MLFLDSTFLIGLILKSDPYYTRSHKLRKVIEKEKILINNTVLTEVLNSLKVINNRPNYEPKLENIFKFLFNDVEIEYLTMEDYIEARNIFKNYNQAINYSDCTILKTMQNHSVNKIISFDSDFDKINGIIRMYIPNNFF